MEFLFVAGVIWALYAWATRDSDVTPKPTRRQSDQSTIFPDSRSRTKSSSVRSEANDGESSLQLIRRAIETDRKLNFQYIDQDGEISERTVTPNYFERRHEAQILCLIAHCHLRNASRTFVVRRMRKVSIE